MLSVIMVPSGSWAWLLRARMLLALALLPAGVGLGRLYKLNHVQREGSWEVKLKFLWSSVLSHAVTLWLLESWDEGSEIAAQPAAC